MITNQDQYYRTVQALNETDFLRVKELSYQPQFQNLDYIASLETHAQKLVAMIDQWERRT